MKKALDILQTIQNDIKDSIDDLFHQIKIIKEDIEKIKKQLN